ncbi:MAG: hypothetical protein EZS28_023522, partial [Streblomastix strix]
MGAFDDINNGGAHLLKGKAGKQGLQELRDKYGLKKKSGVESIFDTKINSSLFGSAKEAEEWKRRLAEEAAQQVNEKLIKKQEQGKQTNNQEPLFNHPPSNEEKKQLQKKEKDLLDNQFDQVQDNLKQTDNEIDQLSNELQDAQNKLTKLEQSGQGQSEEALKLKKKIKDTDDKLQGKKKKKKQLVDKLEYVANRLEDLGGFDDGNKKGSKTGKKNKKEIEQLRNQYGLKRKKGVESIFDSSSNSGTNNTSNDWKRSLAEEAAKQVGGNLVNKNAIGGNKQVNKGTDIKQGNQKQDIKQTKQESNTKQVKKEQDVKQGKQDSIFARPPTSEEKQKLDKKEIDLLNNQFDQMKNQLNQVDDDIEQQQKLVDQAKARLKLLQSMQDGQQNGEEVKRLQKQIADSDSRIKDAEIKKKKIIGQFEYVANRLEDLGEFDDGNKKGNKTGNESKNKKEIDQIRNQYGLKRQKGVESIFDSQQGSGTNNIADELKRQLAQEALLDVDGNLLNQNAIGGQINEKEYKLPRWARTSSQEEDDDDDEDEKGLKVPRPGEQGSLFKRQLTQDEVQKIEKKEKKSLKLYLQQISDQLIQNDQELTNLKKQSKDQRAKLAALESIGQSNSDDSQRLKQQIAYSDDRIKDTDKQKLGSISKLQYITNRLQNMNIFNDEYDDEDDDEEDEGVFSSTKQKNILGGFEGRQIFDQLKDQYGIKRQKKVVSIFGSYSSQSPQYQQLYGTNKETEEWKRKLAEDILQQSHMNQSAIGGRDNTRSPQGSRTRSPRPEFNLSSKEQTLVDRLTDMGGTIKRKQEFKQQVDMEEKQRIERVLDAVKLLVYSQDELGQMSQSDKNNIKYDGIKGNTLQKQQVKYIPSGSSMDQLNTLRKAALNMGYKPEDLMRIEQESYGGQIDFDPQYSNVGYQGPNVPTSIITTITPLTPPTNQSPLQQQTLKRVQIAQQMKQLEEGLQSGDESIMNSSEGQVLMNTLGVTDYIKVGTLRGSGAYQGGGVQMHPSINQSGNNSWRYYGFSGTLGKQYGQQQGTLKGGYVLTQLNQGEIEGLDGRGVIGGDGISGTLGPTIRAKQELQNKNQEEMKLPTLVFPGERNTLKLLGIVQIGAKEN